MESRECDQTWSQMPLSDLIIHLVFPDLRMPPEMRSVSRRPSQGKVWFQDSVYKRQMCQGLPRYVCRQRPTRGFQGDGG